MKPYKEKFERDYQFYLTNKNKFKFAGCVISPPPYDEKGVDAKQAFFVFDSQGKLKPCREPDLFVELMTCKKAINLQIGMWADGQEDCLIPIEELLEEFISPPDWIQEAIVNQIEKVNRKKYGVKNG